MAACWRCENCSAPVDWYEHKGKCLRCGTTLRRRDGMIKYVIHPGEIISKNDGEVHFIDYGQLIRLWAVNPKECMRARGTIGGIKPYPKDAIHLCPDYHGNYNLHRRVHR